MVRYISFDPAIKTLAYSYLEIDVNNEPVLSNCGIIDLTKGDKVKNCSFDQNINELIKELNNLNTNNIDVVLIENIPSRMNPMIKSISVAIYTYFKIKQLSVKFVSPSKKLKNNKVSYKERKQQSIKDVEQYLSKEDYEQISKYKKKDDICDSILQIKAYHKK